MLLTQQTAGYLLKAYLRLATQGPAALAEGDDGNVKYFVEGALLVFVPPCAWNMESSPPSFH